MPISLLSLWVSALFLVPSAENKPKINNAASDIPWVGQKRLSWDDFAGEPAANNTHHALTSTNMEVKVKCENNQLKFKVEAVFNPQESWTRNRESNALLAHEQLHFDITELHARQLRKRLASLPNPCTRGAADLNKYANLAFEAWHQEEDLYDKESRHGLDKAQQQAWQDSVQERLQALEAYQ